MAITSARPFTPTHTILAPEVPREGEIAAVIDRLETGVNNLVEVISRLEHRLDSVLSPSDPTIPAHPCSSQSTALGSRLSDIVHRIHHATHVASEIMERIEL